MRPFEIVLIIPPALYFVLPLLRRRSRWLEALPAVGLLALLCHLLLEGPRWQMDPLYALNGLAALLAVVALRRPLAGRRIGLWAVVGNLGALLLTALAALPPVLLPIPVIPAPTGAYPVGTFARMLVDDSRQEIYSGVAGQPRALMIQVWYPAQAVAGQPPARWLEDFSVVGPSLSTWLDFPSFFLDHVQYSRSHSLTDAPLAQDGAVYPVVLFSHGWNGIRQQSTFLMEELASHGYVVVSIEHPYAARVVVFPDGSRADNNPRALPTTASPEVLDPAARLLVAQWVQDTAFVLNTLTVWNAGQAAGGTVAEAAAEADNRLRGRLDLAHVGVSGHSTGGGAAIEFCGRDPRCQAVLGLDSYMTPVSDVVLENGIKQPALFLFSELWPTARNKALFARLWQQTPQAQVFTLLGAAHLDFSDLPLFSPISAEIGLKGPLDGPLALSIIRSEAVAFFDQTLRGKPAALPVYPALRQESPQAPESFLPELIDE